MAMKDPAGFGKNAGGGGDTYNITALDSQSFEEYLKRNNGVLNKNNWKFYQYKETCYINGWTKMRGLHTNGYNKICQN